ncbi:interleukin-31 receptor subunit alpha-like [Grus japonensis]|uniref:Interleukin-31 receptor subunit alpha-like n=1 Tax=Grus japonensis TaxID=30415 RepID=A0ABC9Y1E6_GRUJA
MVSTVFAFGVKRLWSLTVTQSENIIGYYVTVERIPNSCRDSPNLISLTDRKVFLNLSMAYYRVNISAYNKAGESPQAIYIVPDLSATDLPGQIHVKRQGTNAVVTWTPEYNPKCFVVDWGTGKEDMRMKIVTTATGNFTLDKGEFEGFVTGLCFSMLFILVFAPLTYSLVLKRLKICWPSVPSPRNSSALQDMASILLTTNWKPVSRSLLQAPSENDTTSLYVIEHESKAPLKLDLFTGGGEDSKCDTCQSEEPSNSIDISLRHEEIPEEAVTSEEEEIISITVPLLSDYTSMEFSQKALMSLTMKLPARAARPHLEMELSSKAAQTEHQVFFTPQDYLKQSQVVFLPSGPTLMGPLN